MDDIVETARRAEGSDLLPKVSFGLMNAEQLILRMADTIETMRARVAELESRELECSEYLKDGETPRQRMDRDQSDVLGLMKLLEREKYKSESARDKALEDAEEAVGKVEIPKGGLPPDRVGVWLCALNESMSAIRAMKKEPAND